MLWFFFTLSVDSVVLFAGFIRWHRVAVPAKPRGYMQIISAHICWLDVPATPQVCLCMPGYGVCPQVCYCTPECGVCSCELLHTRICCVPTRVPGCQPGLRHPATTFAGRSVGDGCSASECWLERWHPLWDCSPSDLRSLGTFWNEVLVAAPKHLMQQQQLCLTPEEGTGG